MALMTEDQWIGDGFVLRGSVGLSLSFYSENDCDVEYFNFLVQTILFHSTVQYSTGGSAIV